MLSIKEIRAKYPDYDDLSDEQLMDSLHAKHYSDMPKDEFYSKVGFNQEQPSFLQKAGQYLKSDTANAARNLLTGYLNMGRNIANFPHKAGKLVGLGDVFQPLAPEDYDYGEALGLQKQNENKLIQAVPEVATSFAIPGSTIPRMIAGQAAFGATQDENPLIGAALGGAGAAIGAGAGKLLEAGINKLKPSSLLRGELTPEQLAQNLKNTAGTQTPLGEVIESPSLKRFNENILPHVLGSGTEATAQKTAKVVAQKGEELLSSLRKGEEVHQDYGERIKDALKEASKSAETEKAAKFNKVNELAAQHNIKANRTNLRSEASSILKQIESDPDLAKFTNKADINLLKDIVGQGEKAKASSSGKFRTLKIEESTPDFEGSIDIATGKPIDKIVKTKSVSLKTPSSHSTGGFDYAFGTKSSQPQSYSLKNTDILRGKIGENAHEANVKGEKPKAAIYARLKKALEQDVEQAINKAPHDDLKTAHKEAMDYYKNDYAPFKDKEIRKFVKNGGDPDLILSHFVRIGKADRVHILQKLTKNSQSEGLLGNAYLSPAYENGEINPLKLSTLYHKLGKRQQVELFGKENNAKLKNYVDLVGKNKEAFNLMFNPKTGARLGHIGTLAAAVTHLPATIAASGAAKAANKLLTSESFREKLVKAMIEGKKTKLPLASKILQKSGAASANQNK